MVGPHRQGTHDRYTVVFTGNFKGRNRRCWYVGMSSHPFHPLGIGLHGDHDKSIDAPSGFPPKVGDSCGAMGRRITFAKLPKSCQRLVRSSYAELWELKDPHPEFNFR